MENRDILIDTSILIDFLRKQNKKNSYLWKIKEKNFNCFVSTITVFELYAGAITDIHRKDLKKLLKWFEIIPFSKDISIHSGRIYRELKLINKMIDFRDIFIGATAI